MAELSDEVQDLLRRAEKQPLVADRAKDPVLGWVEMQRHLPQRNPFLFLDRVTLIDVQRKVIAARYDLVRAGAIFAGHFPGRPLFPGVLQIEAIGQAGIVLGSATGGGVRDFALTHVLTARFIRPVPPGGDMEVIAQSLEDGLFHTVVGQVLRDGQVCSVAAVSGVGG